jgi:hypothetical protein
LALVLRGNALSDPRHARHGHAVAQRLVARAIRAVLRRFAAPRDEGVIVFEAL